MYYTLTGPVHCIVRDLIGRELEEAYEAAQADPKFHEEVAWYRREYIGGPTPMYHAKRLSKEMGGAQVGFGVLAVGCRT